MDEDDDYAIVLSCLTSVLLICNPSINAA